MLVDWPPVLKMEPPKPPDPDPFVAGAGVDMAKGLLAPAVKLKPEVEGCGLNPVPVPLPPKAGNEELEKLLPGAADCVGGKLLVALPPNMPPSWTGCVCCAPKPKGLAPEELSLLLLLLLLSPPPKPKLEGCITVCDRPYRKSQYVCISVALYVAECAGAAGIARCLVCFVLRRVLEGREYDG